MEGTKKKLNKSNNTNMLSTYYTMAANCGCGVCGCDCSPSVPSFNSFSMRYIEAGYRNALGN